MSKELTRGQKAWRTRVKNLGGVKAAREAAREAGTVGGNKSAKTSPYSFRNNAVHASEAGTKSRRKPVKN